MSFKLPKFDVVVYYFKWFLIVESIFTGTYGPINLFNSTRSHFFHLWFDFELLIPLVPWMLYVYFSLFFQLFTPIFFLEKNEMSRMGIAIVLSNFIAAVVFLLVPTELGWQWGVSGPNDHILLRILFMIDFPHNLVPSLHISYATIILLTCWRKFNRGVRVLYAVWFTGICASVVLVRQHHIIDIPTGIMLAMICVYAGNRILLPSIVQKFLDASFFKRSS